MKSEPALMVTSATAIVLAVVGLLVAFGVNVSDEQQDALLALVAALVPILPLVGLVIRQFVTPEYKAKQREAQAKIDGRRDAYSAYTPIGGKP